MSTASLRREICRLREHASGEARTAGRSRDRIEFVRSLGIVPDSWQAQLLRSDAPRVLLNCARQSGKSTMAGVLAPAQGPYRARLARS